MSAILQRHICLHEPQEGLVHHRRGLQGMAAPFARM